MTATGVILSLVCNAKEGYKDPKKFAEKYVREDIEQRYPGAIYNPILQYRGFELVNVRSEMRESISGPTSCIICEFRVVPERGVEYYYLDNSFRWAHPGWFGFLLKDALLRERGTGNRAGPDCGSSWFTGEFNGYGDAQFPVGGDTEFLNGLFTVNVASSLAFTGTFTGTDGSTASFSGTFAKDGSSYVATGVSITVKGKTMSMGLMCEPGPYAGSDEGFGEMWGGSEDVQDEPCIALNCAWQNIWKRSDLAAEWKPAFASGTEKTINLADSFLDNLSDGDSLTYAFGANGAVTVTGKIYGDDVNVTAKLNMERCDSDDNVMHCSMQFLANGHLYQQQFTFPRQATVAAADISLSASDFTRLD